MKGVCPLVPSWIRLTSSGMFAVVIVCRPGPKVSSALPSRKKTAAWLSRTITCEPMRKSPLPVWGTRATIWFNPWSGAWMTSIIRAM